MDSGTNLPLKDRAVCKNLDTVKDEILEKKLYRDKIFKKCIVTFDADFREKY